ncbi:hypothetical protein BD410DRAFT_826752 [Rickenella mellea]|uniref:DUF7918 domain-containing protein n=1 Tax=Rickenella mellea TaxID=50990 RepID=A0A4Y7QAT5_9AGAM|nr:hypothetical protein BD410DRAFT_826752 [Rickenella mellea]
MPANDQHECWVQCEGHRLEEYETTVDEAAKLISSWIASVAGKTFAIHHRIIEVDDRNLWMEVKVGGVIVDNVAFTPEMLEPGEVISYEGVRSDSSTLRQFIFSSNTLTNDETQDATADELGTINVAIYFATMTRRRKKNNFAAAAVELQLGPILEKAKKIRDHRVTLSDPINSNEEINAGVTVRASSQSPHVTFRFNYRSREFLLARRIIKPPSSSDLKLKQAHSNVTDSPNSLNARLSRNRAKTGQKVKEESPSSSLIRSRDVMDDLDTITDEALEAEILSRKRRIENFKKERELQEEVEKLEKLRRRRRMKKEASPIRIRKTPSVVIDLTEE